MTGYVKKELKGVFRGNMVALFLLLLIVVVGFTQVYPIEYSVVSGLLVLLGDKLLTESKLKNIYDILDLHNEENSNTGN